jgi:hypothetical protein
MIEVEWRAPHTRLGFALTLVQLESNCIINLRLDGTLKGKQRTIGWEG